MIKTPRYHPAEGMSINLIFYSQWRSLLFVLECNNNYRTHLEVVECVVKQGRRMAPVNECHCHERKTRNVKDKIKIRT